jgi:glycosyltransferase involved in cell wall biosynthesis
MRILALGNVRLLTALGAGGTRLQYYNGLRKRGHDVDVLDYDAVDLCPFIQSEKRLQLTFGFLIQALRGIVSKSYDVVIFSGAESWLAMILLRMWPARKFLLVHHSNGVEPHMYEKEWKHYRRTWWRDRLVVFLQEQSFVHADSIITLSQYDLDYVMTKNYKDSLHVTAIENGISPNFLNQESQFSRGLVIGYCGSWLPRKGSFLIERDITKILREFPEASFLIIGVEKSFDLHAHFPSDTHDQIRLIPFQQERELLIPYYNSVSILVTPSIYESFGNTTAEGMACGCAVITTPTGFSASLQNRQDAIVLPEAVSPELYKAVKELLLNEPLRLAIAKNGQARVQSLSWDTSVKKLETVLQEWLSEKRNGSREA